MCDLPGPRTHFQCEASADTEPRPPGSKPEFSGYLEKKIKHITSVHKAHAAFSCWQKFLLKPLLPWMRTQEVCAKTHRAVVSDPLSSFNRMVQAGPAQVDILAVVVGGQQLQQAGEDHVVVVIHVAKPPAKRQTEKKKREEPRPTYWQLQVSNQLRVHQSVSARKSMFYRRILTFSETLWICRTLQTSCSTKLDVCALLSSSC